MSPGEIVLYLLSIAYPYFSSATSLEKIPSRAVSLRHCWEFVLQNVSTSLKEPKRLSPIEKSPVVLKRSSTRERASRPASPKRIFWRISETIDCACGDSLAKRSICGSAERAASRQDCPADGSDEQRE